jgi:chromate reductase, NAD(P)H dehydrogenase (quinone)
MNQAPPTAQPPVANILGLCGSTRADSLNALLLRYVAGILDPDLHFDIFESLGDLPLYNSDIEAVERSQDNAAPARANPSAVSRLRDAIRAADGLVITTPEYNHAIPGVLKNALDWASRPTTDLPLTGKAILVFVATRSRGLGYRGLSDTVRILTGFANIVVPGPEVVINSAQKTLTTDADGNVCLSDERVADSIERQLRILRDLITTGAAGQFGQAMRQHAPERWW